MKNNNDKRYNSSSYQQYASLLLLLGICSFEADRVEKMATSAADNTERVKSALALASTGDVQGLVKRLDRLGVDINRIYTDRKTLLMKAVEKGDQKATKTILAAACDVDVQNSDGETAAMIAVRSRRLDCLKVLIEHGTNLELTNGLGETAAMIAEKNNQKNCLALLTEVGGAKGCPNVELLYPKAMKIGVPFNTDLTWDTLTLEECHGIERMTRNKDQAATRLSHTSKRITCSIFGDAYYYENNETRREIREIFQDRSNPTEPWTRYNLNTLPVARDRYTRTTKHHVHDIGIVIHPQVPFLCAAPAGKVCSYPDAETGILQIVCPYAIRDMTVSDACRRDTFCLLKTGPKEFALKKGHKFYYTVQGQLMLTGASFCDFVVYTTRDMEIIRIKPDRQVQKRLLPKLVEFYFKHGVNHLKKL
ncbi:unnamed protein product [Lymnaea stagnalis]|uniref:Ankyrin repeat domain-containing protein n=1 Tax=Lymnaea stagnalis TaxID=6523 RepID=A0AAV2HPJ0_LYMST